MFFDADIKGADFPARTLALTYDDGPGARTAELAEYLRGEKIQAAFFVIGRHAKERPEALTALHRCGHTIGNHTYSHPGLVALAEAGGNVVDELTRTDVIVRDFSGEKPIFFRAPYGNWRQVDPSTNEDKEHSIVAEQLNGSARFSDYIGPVNWDISAEDFAFWRRGASAAEAAAAYLREIEAVGRGIVLMHDSSDDPAIARQNRTLELTALLVPMLKRRGYRFAPLEALPAVKRMVAKRIVATRKREKPHVGAPDARHGGDDYLQPQGRDASLARSTLLAARGGPGHSR
jgi:peptidoglycan/xylan/chitin deacetylase (PgdA/CDA1 family)